MENVDDMVMWLKFDNPNNFNINSACTQDLIVHWGKPSGLPKNMGLYRDWGAFFDFGDVLEIPTGIAVTGMIMEAWTISFWTILPMDVFTTHKKHILV